MQGLKDGRYFINIWGWRTCDVTIKKNRVVEGNYPMLVGKYFDEVVVWFMEASPSRGVQIRGER
jgi:hypothetical protein